MFSELRKCHSRPCQNGGECFEHGDEFQCQCAPEFLGLTCKGKLTWIKTAYSELLYLIQCVCFTYIKSHIYATNQNLNTKLEKEKWHIPYLLVEIDYCYQRTCQQKGTCVSTRTGSYCICTSGFTGADCETGT